VVAATLKGEAGSRTSAGFCRRRLSACVDVRRESAESPSLERSSLCGSIVITLDLAAVARAFRGVDGAHAGRHHMTQFTHHRLSSGATTTSGNKLRWIGALFIAASIAGCASTQRERKDATTTSIEELHASMIQTRSQIEKTLDSLDSLMEATPETLRPAYKAYAEDADKVADLADDVDDESRQLRRRSDEWLAGWEKSQSDVRDPELKALSEQRRARALERIQEIDRSLSEARVAFTPFVSNLQDVKTVVGGDLTPNSVAAVSDTEVAQNADRNGRAVSRALADAIEDLQELSETLTPLPESKR
jgi:hypothetical protein